MLLIALSPARQLKSRVKVPPPFPALNTCPGGTECPCPAALRWPRHRTPWRQRAKMLRTLPPKSIPPPPRDWAKPCTHTARPRHVARCCWQRWPGWDCACPHGSRVAAVAERPGQCRRRSGAVMSCSGRRLMKPPHVLHEASDGFPGGGTSCPTPSPRRACRESGRSRSPAPLGRQRCGCRFLSPLTPACYSGLGPMQHCPVGASTPRHSRSISPWVPVPPGTPPAPPPGCQCPP